MLRVIVFLLVLTSASQAQAPQPLTFFRASGPQHASLQPALDCALLRWRAATCLPIDVSYTAAHLVRWRPDAEMPNMGQTGGASWNATRISLNDLMQGNNQAACLVLLHELRHVLSRSNDHSDEDGSVSEPAVSMSRGRITENDLTLVCNKQPCGCFNPEPPRG